ncbi:XRE family transcriptional regulator [Serratia fonticola]|uniref:LexA family transcriptional regulator n=1 Tax=Serratia fonticola TaxID=47917 RepID=A0ABY9PMY9_SERFO|nr:LexA family transcriptional regulator [Serratia fonticola]WMT13501.1 LexA family transcriptional regulator [Serratia fonticola]
MKSKEPSAQRHQFAERLKSKVPTGAGRAFATKAGIGYSTLHNYLSEASSPTLENLVLLAEALDVSIEWLATGKGSSDFEVLSDGANEFSRIARVPFLDQDEFLFMDCDFLQKKEGLSHLTALRVTTDVMEPTFEVGAVLIIDKSIKQLKENQLIVLKKGDNYLFKRVQITSSGYNLLSDNKKYPVLFVSDDDLNTFELIGHINIIITYTS